MPATLSADRRATATVEKGVKTLVIGGGGREHALVWKLLQDDPSMEIIAAPGNPGIATLARCIQMRADDVQGLVAFARAERPDLTIVGPEAPLAAGVVDMFRAEGLAIFGPTRHAARIETSKRFAKELMERAGVPTARASHHTEVETALRAAAEMGAPLVVKASGLAAGKGVVVAATLAEAERAIREMLEHGAHGDAGREILIEEYMEGEELSLFALCDGSSALLMRGAQDHKRLLDGDHGANTGGMGAYAPVSLDTPQLRADAMSRIFSPTLDALRESGDPFTGLLYAGLMLTVGRTAGGGVQLQVRRSGDRDTSPADGELTPGPNARHRARRIDSDARRSSSGATPRAPQPCSPPPATRTARAPAIESASPRRATTCTSSTQGPHSLTPRTLPSVTRPSSRPAAAFSRSPPWPTPSPTLRGSAASTQRAWTSRASRCGATSAWRELARTPRASEAAGHA